MTMKVGSETSLFGYGGRIMLHGANNAVHAAARDVVPAVVFDRWRTFKPARNRCGQIDKKVKVNNQTPAPADICSRLEQMPGLLTVRQVISLLSISRTRLYGMVAQATIPYLRVHSMIRFDPVRLAAWLRACEVGADQSQEEALPLAA